MIQVYTGDGKGKTTAALGLALRAAGHGLQAHIIHFMKGGILYGELESARMLEPHLRIHPMGRPDFVSKENPDPVDVEWARKGMALARELISSGGVAVMVLDEIIVAIDYKLVTEEEVLELLDSAPADMEIVLTGRAATPGLIAHADLVTECLEVKHYFRKGIMSRKGFDH